MYTLSIIIPVYNVEEFLVECLDSVVNVDGIEIVIVNDCTPDNSMQIAQAYKREHQNISIIENEVNEGLGATRNRGIKHASGKYVLFLDSDDYLDTHKLRNLIPVLEESSHDQVLISFSRFSDTKGIWPLEFSSFYEKNHNKVLNNESFKSLVEIINLSQLRILRREKIFEEDLWFPDGIYEDILWSYWYSYSSDSILVINNRLYLYRQRPGTILSSASPRHMELVSKYKEVLRYFEMKNVPEDAMRILNHKFFTHVRFLLFKTERIPQNLKKEFFTQAIESFYPFDYNDMRQKYSLKRAVSVYVFVHFSYEINKNYRDIKPLFSNIKGLKRLFRLALFYVLKVVPSDKKVWVFGSRFSKFSDNSKHFYINNLERALEDNIRFIWISNNTNVVKHVKALGGEAYKRASIKGLYYALLGHYKFVNCWSNDIGFLHTSNGELVNFWHGLPLKTIEYDITSGPQSKSYASFGSKLRHRMPLLKENAIVFNSSEFFEDKMQSSLRPKKLCNLGSPRLDILKQSKSDVREFLERYNFKAELSFIDSLAIYNRVYIYMPTFRDTGRSWLKELEESFDAVNRFLQDNNSCIIFKLHPNDSSLKSVAMRFSNIILCNFDDIYPILPFTDCLISDYSSIIFDYAILQKKMILYAFDKEEYITQSRGLYFDFDEMYKELDCAKTAEELIEYMQDLEINSHYNELENRLGKVHMKELSSQTIYEYMLHEEINDR